MDLKDISLQCGISIFDFWEMTFGEVVDCINAYNNKKNNDLKEQAIMDYIQAQTIVNGIASMLSKENKQKTITEMYSFIFEEENKEQEEEKIKAQLEINKQGMINYINYLKKRGGIESGT